jgi:DsbC/DsbD-like thiol-disulfide interchange protein
MTRIFVSFAFLVAAAMPLAAKELPPGLVSARLLPGWTNESGQRVTALELQLEPGWKTYWRSPGDSGLPPSFDWSGTANLQGVRYHWPAPEAIKSGDALTMGYHDRLVLPLTLTPSDPDSPMQLSAAIDLGLCEKICVPAHLVLTAPEPEADPDPAIEEALARVPQMVSQRPVCKLRDIEDGVQVSVVLPDGQASVAALELRDQPDIWVSGTEIGFEGGIATATADFVGPSGEPFELNTEQLNLTLISPAGAIEMHGCTPQG